MSDSFIIEERHPFTMLEATLRDICLMGDRSVKPYQHASIMLRDMNPRDLKPSAYYVLTPQLSLHKELNSLFWEHGIDIFRLDGMVDYRWRDTPYRMSPPIVETYVEQTLQQQVSVILDGFHRVWSARNEGKSIQVVNITDIQPPIDPIALPVAWDEVRAYETVPPVKRKYRYTSAREYPPLPFTDVPVTDETAKYFLYRDFSPLGSSGIRK
jgi:hypothetical protein